MSLGAVRGAESRKIPPRVFLLEFRICCFFHCITISKCGELFLPPLHQLPFIPPSSPPPFSLNTKNVVPSVLTLQGCRLEDIFGAEAPRSVRETERRVRFDCFDPVKLLRVGLSPPSSGFLPLFSHSYNWQPRITRASEILLGWSRFGASPDLLWDCGAIDAPPQMVLNGEKVCVDIGVKKNKKRFRPHPQTSITPEHPNPWHA